MKLIFTKRDGKYDDLVIDRPDGASDRIRCPKQGIIPHDMVHYAVESELAHRGFLGLVADGRAAAFTTTGGDSENAIERLVETFQAEMWGGRVRADDLLAIFVDACDAHGHSAAAVSVADVERIRTRIDELTAKWEAVPVNGSLSVEL